MASPPIFQHTTTILPINSFIYPKRPYRYAPEFFIGKLAKCGSFDPMALQSAISINTLLSKSDLFSGDRRIEVGKVAGGGIWRRKRGEFVVCRSNDDGMKQGVGGGVPNSNYVVPLNKSFLFTNSSCITRRLAEILRDLNKRIPDNIISTIPPGNQSTLIP